MTSEPSGQTQGPLEQQQALKAFRPTPARPALSGEAVQQRLSALTAELAQARSERLAQRAESERLVNRHSELLKALPAAVVILDGDGTVQECNPAAETLLGEPLRGVPWRELIARAFAPRLHDGHEISLRDGRLVRIAISPLGGEPGQILLLTDLTETRRLQERLGRHKRLAAMGEMAAAVAHQIRTPLASALLFISHLARPALDEHTRTQVAAKIHERLRHLEQLVNDMLVFARGGSFEVEPVPVAQLLAAVQATLEPQLKVQDAILTVADGAGEALVLGNREALLSALLNIAANALQARPAGLRLELQARRAGQAVEILLRDNGPGIPRELHERIFEPFFTTRANGTGLGLAVVQAIAQAHRGAAWLESGAAGSTFGLRLPLYIDPAAGAPAAVLPPKTTACGSLS